MVNRKLSERIIYYRGPQKSKTRIISIAKILKNLNSISDEILEYNEIYWSNFILLVWLMTTLMISSLIFFALFITKNVILLIIFGNFAAIDMISILFLIGVLSQIFTELESTYKLLNSNIQFRMPLVTRLKVISTTMCMIKQESSS